MNREIWWSALDEIGVEHLLITENENAIVFDGTILRIASDAPFHMHYRIECDRQWHVREVKVALESKPQSKIVVTSDGEGNWTDAEGASLPEFTNCFEVDISATPLTNTLPIRRTSLEKGETVEISVLYFLMPEMSVQRSRQRYTCLKNGLYKFEDLGVVAGFSAEIRVDEDGFVLDYPQLFERIRKR